VSAPRKDFARALVGLCLNLSSTKSLKKNKKTRTLEDWDPFALAAKANDADTPTWEQAMNSPDCKGFWEACCREIETLKSMEVWNVLLR
jgi:hypothetical protein